MTHYDPAIYDIDSDDTRELIDRAIALLGATWDDTTQTAEYRDDATRRWYRVHPSDLAALGHRLRDGQRDAYSLWCAACPAEEVQAMSAIDPADLETAVRQ